MATKSAKYDRQWQRTAENKIKRIKKHNGDSSLISKYENNPKWRGNKKPIMKGKITKGKRKLFDKSRNKEEVI